PRLARRRRDPAARRARGLRPRARRAARADRAAVLHDQAPGRRAHPALPRMTAQIVLLNGVGSAGKSSIAKALQAMTARPFLHVPMDAFIDMMPEDSFGHPDWLVFETVEEDGKPSVVIRTGPLAERVFQGMRQAIAAMAAQGNNL